MNHVPKCPRFWRNYGPRAPPLKMKSVASLLTVTWKQFGAGEERQLILAGARNASSRALTDLCDRLKLIVTERGTSAENEIGRRRRDWPVHGHLEAVRCGRGEAAHPRVPRRYGAVHRDPRSTASSTAS